MRRLILMLCGVAAFAAALVGGAGTPAAATDAPGCTGDLVVALDVELMARPGRSERVHSLASPIPAGEWSVTTVSHDEGDGRRRQEQPREQWTLTFADDATVGPTTDLADHVAAATSTDELGTVTLASPVEALTLRHVKEPVSGGTQSVTAVCVGLTRLDRPTTTTTTTPPPTTSAPDDSAAPDPSSTVAPGPTPRTPPRSFTRVSPAPPPAPDLVPSVWINCTTGNAVVVVENRGTAGTVVDIAVSGAGVDAGLPVVAGEAIGTSIPLDASLEDTSVDISVRDTTTGEILVIADEPVDCLADAAPGVAVDIDCPGLTAVVSLHNGGEAPIELTVIQERVGALEPVTLAAGDTVDVEVPLSGPDFALRVVDGDGVDVVRRTIAVGCPGVTWGPTPDESASDESTEDPDDGDPSAATIDATIDIDCSGPTATVEVGRDGGGSDSGSERLVVLVDGDVAQIIDLTGADSRQIELDVDDGATIAVARAGSETPIVTSRVSCDDGGGGTAGLVASSLVVLAVLASAAGVLPGPLRTVVTGS